MRLFRLNEMFSPIVWFLIFALFALQLSPVRGSATLGDLSGTVVDKATGKPVAQVTAIASGNGRAFVTTTDASGYFSFVDLEPGNYKITLELVGYQSTDILGIPVSADSTYFQQFTLVPAIYKTQGVTVVGYANPTVNPRETMTYYQMSLRELNELLPGPASLNTNSILEELPGVQTYAALGGYALSMPGGPHVRGGTGMGTVYALDGIPLNNFTLFGDPGNLGLTTGLSDFQFYPGVYPVQYGNGMDGYQNTLVPEGYGSLHGSLQFSYGFWLDQGENSPIFAANSLTGAIGNVTGASNIRPANPDYWDLQLSGQSGKFHYFLSTIAEDGGMSGYANSTDEAAITYSGIGGEVYRKAFRDGILKLNYDIDENDEAELLLASGFDTTSAEFETPIGNGSQATFAPVPPFTAQSYNIESLELTHRFSPGSALNFKAWLYDSNPDYYSPTPADGYYLQNDIARQTGGRLEYETQMNPQSKLTAGLQYIYTNDTEEMILSPPNPLAYLAGNPNFAGANNQNPSAWLSEEWTPTPKWDINVGVRWDKMIYQTPNVPGLITQPNGLPYANEGFTGFSPDAQINNPNDIQGNFTNCTPQFNICSNSGIFDPSFIQPRISASYRLSDDFTIKGGFGEFNTFADDMNVLAASTLCAKGTGLVFGVPCQVTGNIAYTTSGNLPESGNQYELSFEYVPEPGSFIKVTPYYKTVNNPLVYTYVPIAAMGAALNAQSLSSDGVEMEVHTSEWHGLTGTLDYTYNNSTIIGNAEYAFPFLPQFIFANAVAGAGIFQPNALPNAAALYSQAMSAPTSADWNVRNTLNLLLDYKPNKKWEIAPNFTFMSGQPFGFGAAQLKSLYANLEAACAGGPTANDPYLTPAACAADLPANGNYNPLGETLANSLTGPNTFLTNLALTYHATSWLSTTLSIFNLFNNKQILAYNSTPYLSTYMGSLGFPFAMDYSPLRGQYAPLAVQPIREYFLTTTFKF